MTGPGTPAVVYLDVDDEITSAAARLRAIEAERVVFVLPYGSRLATSRINFRLLAREAAGRGKQLEIVAADASARALAGTAGLPVHASVAAFEGRAAGPPEPGAGLSEAAAPGGAVAEWPVAPVVPGPSGDATDTRVLTIPRAGGERVPEVGRRRPLVRPRTALAIALVLLLLLGGGGVAAFLYLPSATIVLRPASQALGPVELSIDARTDVSSPDPSSLIVPAREYGFELAANQTFTTTGTKVVETPATGFVTFTWYGNQTQITIAAGSQVGTASGVVFATQQPVSIDRSGNGRGRSSQPVPVTAVATGIGGNVAAGAINVLVNIQANRFYDGLLFVTNQQPTTGGTHAETPQVSQQDVDAATATLEQALRDNLTAQIGQAAGVPAGTTLLESTAKVGTPTPSVDPSTLVGQAVATFDLGLTATGTALGVDTAPVQAVAATRLASRVDSGWQLVDGSTSIQIGRPIVSGAAISFQVTASAMESHAVDRNALLAQIQGLDLPRARVVLAAYGDVSISLWPDWVTTIPTNSSRISLTIEAGGAPAPSPSPG